MSWAQTGYEEIDNASAVYEGGASSGDKVREFWTPIGETKRVVVLDDNPFGFWTHSLWALGVKDAGTVICLDRNGDLNKTHGKCPFCEMTEEHKNSKGAKGMQLWPAYVGYITVVDCGSVKNSATGQKLEGYVSAKGIEYNFDRKLLPLKKGGKDKPGLLLKMRRLREKRGGSLVGAVIDVYRGGQKEERVGAEWEWVERVDVSSVDALHKSLRGLDGFRADVHDKLVNENIKSNAGFDYMSVFEPKNRAQLLAMIGKGSGASQPAANTDSEPGFGFEGSDDEIPF
jgi:hypothetical protein